MRVFFMIFLVVMTSMGMIQAQPKGLIPTVDKPVFFDVSPPLRDMYRPAIVPVDRSWKEWVVPNRFDPDEGLEGSLNLGSDPGLQQHVGSVLIDTILSNFDGISASGSVPPDTYGEAGPEHYFQVVNTSYAIFNKNGEVAFGPVPNSAVWQGMPNNDNSGDAVVLWDENANRWLFSQFSLPNYPAGPFFQMIAISQTSDPTGSWYRYQYEFPVMPDYPKFGVWPDGYYMSSNNFGNSGFADNGAYAYDRQAMLSGDPDAVRVSFTLQAGGGGFGFSTFYPADCDGEFPPYGTPNYFGFIKRSGSQYFGIYEFHADFSEPANSTFGNLLQLPVAGFNASIDGIPQLGTSVKLDDISDRLMYRIQFRKFAGHWSMVANHTVNVGAEVAGIRWYEFRKGSGDWSVYQEGTYAPADGHSRWMGSMAMDTAGSIALGYSVSSASMYPSIRVTGRRDGDPLNQMTLEEMSIIEGGGAQTGTWSGRSRWGDYSGMSVDPMNPTTFWYTNEYYANTSSSGWRTRIGSFTFDNVFSTSASAYPSLLCLGDDTVHLSALAYGGTGAYSWSWSSIPPGFTSTLQFPMDTPTDTTWYIVSTNDGLETRVDTVSVKIVFPPVAEAGNDTAMCVWMSSIDLQGAALHYKNFVWGTFGDGAFSDMYALATTYTPGEQDRASGGTDLVLLAFAQSPCLGKVMDTLHLVIDPCTGIGEPISGAMKLAIHPNPASGQTTILLSGIREQKGMITVSSIEGKEVYQQTLEVLQGRYTTRLDLTGYTPGIYVVQVQTDDGIAVEKLIIR